MITLRARCFSKNKEKVQLNQRKVPAKSKERLSLALAFQVEGRKSRVKGLFFTLHFFFVFICDNLLTFFVVIEKYRYFCDMNTKTCQTSKYSFF